LWRRAREPANMTTLDDAANNHTWFYGGPAVAVGMLRPSWGCSSSRLAPASGLARHRPVSCGALQLARGNGTRRPTSMGYAYFLAFFYGDVWGRSPWLPLTAQVALNALVRCSPGIREELLDR